jgi:hypothetical protein
MDNQFKHDQLVAKLPHQHKNFFSRPHWTRRHFFGLVGSAVSGSFLAQRGKAAEITKLNVQTMNTAENVIFVFLAGAPSHVDLFDFKNYAGVTPAAAAPETVNGILFPTGILPKLKDQLGDIAIMRSVRSWALVHGLSQTWLQIGRNPTSALGSVSPNIGSVVALEKEVERRPGQFFPTFLALNSGAAAGSGYLPSMFAPFKTAPSVNGLPGTTHPDGEAALNERITLMRAQDDVLRVNSPYGRALEDMDAFYQAARGMMYNPAVDRAFRIQAADRARYAPQGVASTGFGDACLVAKQVLEAKQGTRFVQVTLGGWDMHGDIYGANGNIAVGNNIFTLGRTFDAGLSGLIADLKAGGLFEKTLVVVAGEFGRTVGALSAQRGRDHFMQQFALMAGGGIKGGRVIGKTNDAGSATVEAGWKANRDIRAEDLEATIYSALGINWTTTRYDDPFGRGFEYVPYGKEGLYEPVHDLFS